MGNVQAIIDSLVKSQHAAPDSGISIPAGQDIRDAVSFEVSLKEVLVDLDIYVDEIFGALQSKFLTLPKSDGFLEYPVFEQGYEALKRTTKDFRDLSVEPVLQTVQGFRHSRRVALHAGIHAAGMGVCDNPMHRRQS